MKSSTFRGYQILGASNMVRFCSTILNIRPQKNAHGSAAIDLCVSGQGITALEKRLKRTKELHKNILICIGTNDVIRMKSVRGFKMALRTIVKLLRNKNIVFLTIPPIPKFSDDDGIITKINRLNREILKLDKFEGINVLDLHNFCIEDGTININLYSKFYTRPRGQRHLQPKCDLIHFNTSGLKKMHFG